LPLLFVSDFISSLMHLWHFINNTKWIQFILFLTIGF
jgi:hypothetical protein